MSKIQIRVWDTILADSITFDLAPVGATLAKASELAAQYVERGDVISAHVLVDGEVKAMFWGEEFQRNILETTGLTAEALVAKLTGTGH